MSYKFAEAFHFILRSISWISRFDEALKFVSKLKPSFSSRSASLQIPLFPLSLDKLCGFFAHFSYNSVRCLPRRQNYHKRLRNFLGECNFYEPTVFPINFSSSRLYPRVTVAGEGCRVGIRFSQRFSTLLYNNPLFVTEEVFFRHLAVLGLRKSVGRGARCIRWKFVINY